MGFGTVFVGYLFLLNMARPEYTDALCGAILLWGLYKLSAINKPFAWGAVFAGGFCLFGLVELGNGFLVFLPASLSWILYVLRYVLLLGLTVCLLWGIRTVAKEVGLSKLQTKVDTTVASPVIVYLCCMALEWPAFYASIPDFIGALVVLFEFAMIVWNAFLIYDAYGRICMPGDEDMARKPSRFAFVNKIHEAGDRKQKEDIDTMVAEMRRKQNKKKK